MICKTTSDRNMFCGILIYHFANTCVHRVEYNERYFYQRLLIHVPFTPRTSFVDVIYLWFYWTDTYRFYRYHFLPHILRLYERLLIHVPFMHRPSLVNVLYLWFHWTNTYRFYRYHFLPHIPRSYNCPTTNEAITINHTSPRKHIL